MTNVVATPGTPSPRPSASEVRAVVAIRDFGTAAGRRLALWLAGIVAAAVPVAPHLLAWVRNKPFDDSAILGFLASVLFITALGYFEFSVIRHPKMTDPYSIRWTKRLGWLVAVGAIVAAVNSWVFPKGLPAQVATDFMRDLVLHSWAGYLGLGVVGELWLAYELLSWEARVTATARTEGA